MAKRNVVWTKTAVNQRHEILSYWTKRNGSTKYAEKLIQLTANQVKLILSHPKSFKPTSYPDTYMTVMGYFSIYFKVTDDLIIITAFWDNRQDPKKLHALLKEKY